MTDNPLTRLQQERNRKSASNWVVAKGHRDQLSDLLINHRIESNPTLCILGAGNCNDLDLRRLNQSFERIDLVDIDGEALERGIQSQGLTPSKDLRLIGDCDVTGVWDELANQSEHDSISDERLEALLSNIQHWPGFIDLGSFGTVASTCLLSQLIEGTIRATRSHARCLEAITAIRARHLHLLYALTANGGNAVLVTDFVSSDTAPELPQLSGQVLADRLMQMISEKNFFVGLNPMRITALLQQDRFLAGKITDLHCARPWLWNLGPRYYAVTAVSFCRRA